jgi:hydroxyacylglutathione hydrolase
MKKVNKIGPALLADLPATAEIGRDEIEAAVAAGHLVIDLRGREPFVQSHLPGTVSIPATSRTFSTYVGWFVDFAQPLYLVVPSKADVEPIITSLRAIGVDEIAGVATAEAIIRGESLPVLTARELAERLPLNGLTIIDVRGRAEYAEQHIRGAKNIPLGYLPRHLAEIPRDSQVVLQCASGYRSQIATSLLRAHGLTNVANLTDGQSVWAQVLPVE